MSEPGGQFFIVGGTLSRDARCYVTRRADADLFAALNTASFCDVLTSRQMGKSSLMVRTALRLREAGRAVAILDLTALGQNLSPQQWYEGLLLRLGAQLGQEDALEAFWEKNATVAPLQRWMRAIREVALPACGRPLVIFVDEIDFVRSLPFNTDEFFAAIRECYNRRTEESALRDLTFCLLGVATPADLIRDVRTTPFNIGRRIELADFTEQEIQAFAEGFGSRSASATGILARIHYWTGGHPYLTQRLCQSVADDPTVTGPVGVDRICEDLFLSNRARERDDNLVFVRERLLRAEVDRASLLDMYRKVRGRQHIRDDETSSLVGILRLSGITRVQEGYLWVRNRIYYRVFDKDWIIANLPDAEKRRQAAAYRRGALRASVATAIIFAATFGGAHIHSYLHQRDYERDYAEYFGAYVKKFGEYQGICPLTEDQVHHRAVSYRIVHKGRLGEILRLETVNADENLTSSTTLNLYLAKSSDASRQADCQHSLVRDRQGRVVYEQAFDRAGKMVWGFIYSPSNEAKPLKAQAVYIGPEGIPRPLVVEIDYTPEGYEGLVKYFGRDHKPVPGNDGAYARRATYDWRGLPTSVTRLDQHGNPEADNKGRVETLAKWDAFGNIVEASVMDAKGNAALDQSGVHRAVMQYDSFGRSTSIRYFDVQNNPVISKKEGVAGVDYERGVRGEAQGFRYVGIDGKPLEIEGCAGARTVYDPFGNLTSLQFVDAAGTAVLCSEGYSKVVRRYENDNLVATASYGLDGKSPVATKAGYASVKIGYDGSTRTSWYCYGVNGEPAIDQVTGASGYTAKFDESGRESERHYVDRDGKPANCKDGFARIDRRYDTWDDIIQEHRYDAADRPLPYANGSRSFLKTFDERGNLLEVTHLDGNDYPMNLTDGYATEKMSYDKLNHRITWACFGVDGTAVLDNSRVHAIVSIFDSTGRETERRMRGVYDEDVMSSGGFATVRKKYDAGGTLSEQLYFDIRGNPVAMRVLVTKLNVSGQGALMGLHAGDVLVSYDGKPVQSFAQFFSAVDHEKAGSDARVLKVRRGRQILDFPVAKGDLGITLTDRAASLVDPRPPSASRSQPQTAPAAAQAATP